MPGMRFISSCSIDNPGLRWMSSAVTVGDAGRSAVGRVRGRLWLHAARTPTTQLMAGTMRDKNRVFIGVLLITCALGLSVAGCKGAQHTLFVSLSPGKT